MRYALKVMKDYKLRTASMCLDKDDAVNIVFMDARHAISDWAFGLVHFRNGIMQDISTEGMDEQRPSCIADEDGLYVLTQHFDGTEGALHELHLLITKDYSNWDDITIDSSSKPFHNPTFSKLDNSGYKRFVWTEGLMTIEPIQIEPATLKYGYFVTPPPPKPHPPVNFKRE